MTGPLQTALFRFGVFEADAATGELRRQGVRIKVNVQPFQVLVLLLERPGQILTREEIARELWPDGTFVDFDHGVNSAVNRIREALSDSARNPRFIETLARRGYRFIAPVERVVAAPLPQVVDSIAAPPIVAPAIDEPDSHDPLTRFLASPADLPRTPRRTVQILFVLLQLMYVGFYVGALSNLAEISDLLASLSRPTLAFVTVIVTASLLIPVRAFLLSAVLFHAPGLRGKYHTLWPLLLPFDELWALSPFLLLHHISFGLALACTAFLAYAPFAQRSLLLMGAGDPPASVALHPS